MWCGGVGSIFRSGRRQRLGDDAGVVARGGPVCGWAVGCAVVNTENIPTKQHCVISCASPYDWKGGEGEYRYHLSYALIEIHLHIQDNPICKDLSVIVKCDDV